jgi:hypothetical protein
MYLGRTWPETSPANVESQRASRPFFFLPSFFLEFSEFLTPQKTNYTPKVGADDPLFFFFFPSSGAFSSAKKTNLPLFEKLHNFFNITSFNKPFAPPFSYHRALSCHARFFYFFYNT